MPYEPNDSLLRHFEENGADLTQQVEAQLQLIAPNSPNIPLYRDMILTVLRMAQDDRNRWNAKITLQAIRELDHAFRVLEQFKGRRKVTVFGSARTPVESPLYALAREVGAALALAGPGRLAMKKAAPIGQNSLPTHGPLFVTLLTVTILLVGGLTFLPTLALGPIAEHLSMGF